jgi:hypothetical protein
MSDKNGQNDEAKWHFFWKNIDGLGRLTRLSLGIALIIAAREMKEDKNKSGLLQVSAAWLLVEGFFRWAPWRAFLGHPSKRARLRHYPG